MISFIVPVYNVEKYLERCIESLLRGGSDDCEVILVDDGSKDDSGVICDRYAEKYPNIKVIHKINGGLSDARNEGIKAATGDYLFFLDSDDYLVDGAVHRMNVLLKQNAEVDILFLSVKVISDRQETIWKKNGVSMSNPYTGIDFLKAELKGGNYKAMAPNGVYRRKFIVDNELFFKKGILHEDEQWSPRVTAKAQNVLALDEVFYTYEIREDSITTKKDKTKNALDLMDTCHELREYFAHIDDEELQRLEKRYLAKLYMGAVVRGIYCGDKKRVLRKCDKAFVKNDGIVIGDGLRLTLFRISPCLYALIFKHLYV